MKTIMKLPGLWEFREFPENARTMQDLEQGHWLQTSQPGSIFLSLAEAGIICLRDLYANPEAFGWISRQPWIFRQSFDISPQQLACDRIDLCFEGIDTVSQIWLNGKLIGRTDNMFIEHVFDISHWLTEGKNVLAIKFTPPVEYAIGLMRRYGKIGDCHFGDPSRVFLRKAQYQFGSAMGPSLAGCGIFRPVRLEFIQKSDLADIHIRTIDCNSLYADIRIAVGIRRILPCDNVLCLLTIRGENLELQHQMRFNNSETELSAVLRIDRPALWWPLGYGRQSLYTLDTRLYADDIIADQNDISLGIRTITSLDNSRSEDGSFGITVNQQPIYLKGTDWTPPALMPSAQDAHRKEHLLQQLAAANFNTLRVWGGGCYEDNTFYDLCDQMGFLVWQDFMFASAYYPEEDWFTAQIRLEASDIIHRLRNHPSLVVWNGNSRADWLHYSGRLGKSKKFSGKNIYQSLLPELLCEQDPDRVYLPTIPSVNTKISPESTPATGELWPMEAACAGVYKPSLVSKIPGIVVEAGVESMSAAQSLQSICPPDQLFLSSFSVEKMNFQSHGAASLAAGAEEFFSPPKNLEQQIFQSQLVQARKIKSAVEYLRSQCAANHGIFLWTAGDFWPSTAFSMIDFFGNPKALYYYARRFFAPVLICLTNPGLPTQNFVPGPGSVMTIINDTDAPLTATATIALLDTRGNIIDKSSYPLSIRPHTQTPPAIPPRIFTSPPCPERNFLSLTLARDDQTIAENLYLFLPDKFVSFQASHIDTEFNLITPTHLFVSMQSRYFIKDLQIIPCGNGRLSDNFFDLLPHQTYNVSLDFEKPITPFQTPLTFLNAAD